MARKKKSDVADLVTRYTRAREAGKRGYERADRLIHEIAAAVGPGEEIQLSESGRKAVLVDRFADAEGKGVIWTPCAARRWELKIIEP
ncbi:MAG: hypothetical protein ABSE45_14965 [Candidatus Acidiferrales bacterium]|jgi:hypothetical protein